MKQKIAILGCGWLGLPLGIALVSAGYTVKGSTTTSAKLEKLASVGIDPFYILVSNVLEGTEIAAFFEVETLIINIPPKRNLLEVETLYPIQITQILEAAKNGKVANVLFVSSTGVYPENNQIATEITPAEPSQSNTRGLVVAEQIVQRAGFNWTILRMAGLIGGTRKPGRFFAGKTDLPEANAPVNLVHLDDCIGVIATVIQQNCWGEIFNVCADEHPTKKEFYSSQALKEGLEVPRYLLPSPPAAFKVVSNTKVKTQLHYTFIHPDPMLFEA